MVSYVDRLGRRYRRPARPLSPRSVNMHIDLLAQILAVAVDHAYIPSSPAIGKRRRLRVSKPRPVHLDSAEQIAILMRKQGREAIGSPARAHPYARGQHVHASERHPP